MRKYLLFVCIIFIFFLSGEAWPIDYPEAPRVSSYEVYEKYKAGKAILIHAGGEDYKKRHIIGALEIPWDFVREGKMEVPNLPRTGKEYFTYCY